MTVKEASSTQPKKKESAPKPKPQESTPASVSEINDEHVVELEPEVTTAIQSEIRRAISIYQESYSGPMPKPEHLERYDKVVPGAAKDIVEEFKANGAHIRKMETLATEGTIAKNKRGQNMAFLLVIIGLVVVTYLAINGQPAVAIVIAGTLLVAVITGFLVNKPMLPSSAQDDGN